MILKWEFIWNKTMENKAKVTTLGLVGKVSDIKLNRKVCGLSRFPYYKSMPIE